jgi:hypothetical protein
MEATELFDPIPEDAFSSELLWQPGPAQGGGLPPETAEVVLALYHYSIREWLVFQKEDNRWTCNQWDCSDEVEWDKVEKWLVIK